MKSFRDYLNIIDGVQPIAESHSKFPEESSKPIVDMKRYDNLDNNNPYMMWRFLVAVAEQPLEPGATAMTRESPVGDKLATIAYTQADADILNAAARSFGEPSVAISSKTSQEPASIQKVSPVTAFKGYPR